MEKESKEEAEYAYMATEDAVTWLAREPHARGARDHGTCRAGALVLLAPASAPSPAPPAPAPAPAPARAPAPAPAPAARAPAPAPAPAPDGDGNVGRRRRLILFGDAGPIGTICGSHQRCLKLLENARLKTASPEVSEGMIFSLRSKRFDHLPAKEECLALCFLVLARAQGQPPEA
ncbi:hypothetical protein MUK42_36353 [Musa troglodytarum]|uniref:Uncharacterized protein n=1 Tax=Musa troglodytarum TaxID=320322 RepID=A0A9E7GEY5_9LILI|nr:hypothetical protein MUK42_36353 [Musa troglodytarum]